MPLKIEDITALIDSREQAPYSLEPMKTESAGLYSGDYSIKGLESIVAVERKELSDYLACCGRNRDRFEKQLTRLAGLPHSAVVIEASWQDLERGEWRSKLTPRQMLGSTTGWLAAGHNLILAGNRDMAQRINRAILFHVARRRLREARGLLRAAPFREQ